MRSLRWTTGPSGGASGRRGRGLGQAKNAVPPGTDPSPRRPPTRTEPLTKRPGPQIHVSHDPVGKLLAPKVIDQPLLVHGRMGQRISAGPSRLHAEVAQIPDQGAADE